MSKATQKQKLFNENLNAIHDRLDAIVDGVQSLQDARRRIKAALLMNRLVETLGELDVLLDPTGR